MAEISLVFNNNNSWVAPNNDIISVECIGSGGGGGSTNLAANASGGGGGGAYAHARVQVVAGRIYTIQAPPGGANGAANANGAAGNFSQFAWNNANNWTIYVRAAGGLGGRNNNAGGAGGTVANSWGETCFRGGSGAAGVAATGIGGGGGAGAHFSANGNNASGATGGVGFEYNYGGNGATGGASGENAANNATVAGGGGGGAGNNTGTQRYGSPGKNGHVIIHYRENTAIAGKVTLAGANQADARVIIVASDDNNAANSFVVGVATANAQGNWTQTVPSNKVINAIAQHNNATAQYTAKAQPFIPS